MSRNKDIEFLHKLTQEPYSVCRRKMKENHWRLSEALMDGTMLASVSKAMNEVVKTFQKALQPVVEKTIEACKELKKLIEEEYICPCCSTKLLSPWPEYETCPYCGEYLADASRCELRGSFTDYEGNEIDKVIMDDFGGTE